MRIFPGTLLILGAFVACSGANEPALNEYPPVSDLPPSEPGSSHLKDGGPGTRSPDGGAIAGPIVGKKIANGSIFLEGATSDGAIVFQQDPDLMVWPAGAAAPLRFVRDYRVGEDSLQIRGRFAVAWLGEDIRPSSPTLWASTGGIQTVAPKVARYALYPRPNSDEFVYLAPLTTSILRRDVWATKAGGGAGTKVVSDLDAGLTEKQCRPTITYSDTDLVIAGCTNGATTPTVTAYALDGSNATKTILDGSAPGVFVNRARTHAIVQTSTDSSIRPLSGLGSPAPLDGPVSQAWFSSDDSNVVYLHGDGKVKRASTASPTSPVEIFGAAKALLSVSADARFVLVATKGDVSKNRTDIIAVDAMGVGPDASRVLVSQGGTLVGTSKSGAIAVYLGDPGTLVEVIDVLPSERDAPILVMPLLSGESLDRVLLRTSPLPEREALELLEPVVAGMHAAHARGVIHRDLKPPNVFIADDGSGARTVLVLDFGLAKILSDDGTDAGADKLTRTGALLGTPWYMAPEQLFGDDSVDHRADVWAIGAMLYECLSGRRPIEGRSYGQIARNVARSTIAPLPTDVDPILATLTARMLDKDREGRPGLGEVHAAFRSLLDRPWPVA